jgi:hypothetical protein
MDEHQTRNQEPAVHHTLKELLHDYKRNVFQLAHHQKDVESITQECVHMTEDVLQQHYRFHFNKLPDANRAEIINMISNYVREAILPPVVTKIAERHVVLERRITALEGLLAASLEVISHDHEGSRT